MTRTSPARRSSPSTARRTNPYAETLASTTPSPEQMIEHRERLTYMVEAVAELPERLRVVVQEYFLGERPMAEIAEKLGVSESRVSQMRAEALVLLKDAINAQLEPELVTAPARPEGCAARRREAYFAAVAARHAAGARQVRPARRGLPGHRLIPVRGPASWTAPAASSREDRKKPRTFLNPARPQGRSAGQRSPRTDSST